MLYELELRFIYVLSFRDEIRRELYQLEQENELVKKERNQYVREAKSLFELVTQLKGCI